MDKKKLVLLLLASTVLFMIGFIYGLKNNDSTDTRYDGNIDLSSGVYVRLVFIGSSDCFYSNNEETHHMITYIKSELDKTMGNASLKFISTGISYDLSITAAIEYLEKTGPYDEILVGGGAFNLGVINYAAGGTSTPKILLFLEVYETELIGLNMINFKDSQQLLKTFTGQFEIQALYEFIGQSSDSALADYLSVSEYLKSARDN